MKIDTVSIILYLLLAFSIFMMVDCLINVEEKITNKRVDCIDGENNFISNEVCYKRVSCGNTIKFFDSKYCDKEFINAVENEQ